jgi:hypothetical protein
MRLSNSNELSRLLFSILLIPIGAVLVLLNAGSLVSNIGLAFIVAGVVSTFHEGVLRRLEGAENTIAIADGVVDRLKAAPLTATGIRLVSPVRKGYDGYYLWAMNSGPQEMFFAGRSVLHRIDADFRARTIGSAEAIVARRVKEGASIKILFLDPRCDIIHRLADEEGQSTKDLLRDVATSLGICERLHSHLKDLVLPATASLEIRVFDEIPYFAYHKVDSKVIVGFYFSSALGHQSAAFEVVDLQTKEFFDAHFTAMFARAATKYVLRIDPHRRSSDLNALLVAELRTKLDTELGQVEAHRAMGGQSSAAAG